MNKINITKKEIDLSILQSAIEKYKEKYKKEPQFLIMSNKTADSLYDNYSGYFYRYHYNGMEACLGNNYQRIINKILNIPVAIREAFLFGEVEII